MKQIEKGDVVSYTGFYGEEIGKVSRIYHDDVRGVDRASIENDDGSWSEPLVSECVYVGRGNPFF